MCMLIYASSCKYTQKHAFDKHDKLNQILYGNILVVTRMYIYIIYIDSIYNIDITFDPIWLQQLNNAMGPYLSGVSW